MSGKEKNIEGDKRLNPDSKPDALESMVTVGVDATNLRAGGGLTHLVELLSAANPAKQGILKVIVWGGEVTLAKLPHRAWLEKIGPPALNRSLLCRMYWQRFRLGEAARAKQCDVLFVPGGSYSSDFGPVVTMSQNLLPFEWRELRRYGFSFMTLKLYLLRLAQSSSFRKATGIVFLTDFAKKTVLEVTGPLSGRTATVRHGVSSRFRMPVKLQRSIDDYRESDPFHLIYVSIVDQYKHQWHLVEAAHQLRAKGVPLVLDLVGPAYGPALKKLNESIEIFDPDREWVNYLGVLPHDVMHTAYSRADLVVFASSCENMPIILLEAMASGLPTACSNRGPMPEVLGDAGLYFDPENPTDIAETLLTYIGSPVLRRKHAEASIERSLQYDWSQTADKTLEFLVDIVRVGSRD